ncbi:hypothetical protein HC928_08915 [bacterium]|nr:hypothetical protein [bacterium]
MPQTILSQIIEQLQTLEPFELQQLSQAIEQQLKDRETSTRQSAFHQALVEAGLVKQVKYPSFERATHQQLIRIQGESVSQTIIEERR